MPIWLIIVIAVVVVLAVFVAIMMGVGGKTHSGIIEDDD